MGDTYTCTLNPTSNNFDHIGLPGALGLRDGGSAYEKGTLSELSWGLHGKHEEMRNVFQCSSALAYL